MKHRIEVENYVRKTDGSEFNIVRVGELAGVDFFSLACVGATLDDALSALAARLRLASRDAEDVANQIEAGLSERGNECERDDEETPVKRLALVKDLD